MNLESLSLQERLIMVPVSILRPHTDKQSSG